MKTYDEARTGAALGARQLRRASTEAEKLLWTALHEKLSQQKWRRQLPIGPYFADFACIADRLIVELDGGQHMASAEYDEVRSGFLRAQGYRVLRFWNNEVLENIEGVLAQISLSPRERPEADRFSDGPTRTLEGGAQRRKGEADRHARKSSSPSRAFGAHPSPGGRGRQASRP